ncbi:Reverse transcriptase, RNA-dependent DNA polymerase, partial [Thalictrum thalictroides]
MSSTPSQQESSDESSTFFTVILKDNPIRQISLNNIVILTGQSTYETWAIMMITLWRTMGLYELVVDGIKPILNAGKEEIKAYTVLRNSAIGTFLQVVHADILKVLLEKSDPHLMWTYLVTEFKRDTAYALVYQLGNLCHLFTAYDATKTLSEFIQLFENEWYKLYRLARDSNEEYRQDFANFLQKDLVKRDFLLGFLSRYKKNIVDNLTTKTDLTFAVVKQRLLDIDYEETTHTALAT